jgi:hypothetical protein
MLTLPTQPLTRIRPGHGEAGRQVNIDGIYRDWQGAVLVHGRMRFSEWRRAARG